MSSILFILGKDRDLSLAELCAIYPQNCVKQAGKEFVWMELQHPFSQSEFNRLGGAIKAAQFAVSVKPSELVQALFEILRERHRGSKLLYGLSLYDWPQGNLRRLLLDLKKSLRGAGLSSRFLNQDFQNLTSAHSKGLKHDGVELVVAKIVGEFAIGEVIASQDIDAYSFRDYEKPYRSMKVGMLPPKLSQILINLTGLHQGVIWDPFCGGGGVILEGLLMGYDMLGSDIDTQVLKGTRQNVGWLQKEFNVHQKVDLFVHDATRPLKGKKFDAIVCEGYLGPPQERQLRADQLQPLIVQLEKLYVDFFTALSHAQFKGPVVIAMPFFRAHEGRDVMLDGAVKKIKQLGFQPTLLLPSALVGHETFFLKYARPDQLVGRAIYRFN